MRLLILLIVLRQPHLSLLEWVGRGNAFYLERDPAPGGDFVKQDTPIQGESIKDTPDTHYKNCTPFNDFLYYSFNLKFARQSCVLCTVPDCDFGDPSCVGMSTSTPIPLYWGLHQVAFLWGFAMPKNTFVRIGSKKAWNFEIKIEKLSSTSAKFLSRNLIGGRPSGDLMELWVANGEFGLLTLRLSNNRKLKIMLQTSKKHPGMIPEGRYRATFTLDLPPGHERPAVQYTFQHDHYFPGETPYRNFPLLLPCSPGGFYVNPRTGKFLQGKELKRFAGTIDAKEVIKFVQLPPWGKGSDFRKDRWDNKVDSNTDLSPIYIWKGEAIKEKEIEKMKLATLRKAKRIDKSMLKQTMKIPNGNSDYLAKSGNLNRSLLDEFNKGISNSSYPDAIKYDSRNNNILQNTDGSRKIIKNNGTGDIDVFLSADNAKNSDHLDRKMPSDTFSDSVETGNSGDIKSSLHSAYHNSDILKDLVHLENSSNAVDTHNSRHPRDGSFYNHHAVHGSSHSSEDNNSLIHKSTNISNNQADSFNVSANLPNDDGIQNSYFLLGTTYKSYEPIIDERDPNFPADQEKRSRNKFNDEDIFKLENNMKRWKQKKEQKEKIFNNFKHNSDFDRFSKYQHQEINNFKNLSNLHNSDDSGSADMSAMETGSFGEKRNFVEQKNMKQFNANFVPPHNSNFSSDSGSIGSNDSPYQPNTFGSLRKTNDSPFIESSDAHRQSSGKIIDKSNKETENMKIIKPESTMINSKKSLGKAANEPEISKKEKKPVLYSRQLGRKQVRKLVKYDDDIYIYETENLDEPDNYVLTDVYDTPLDGDLYDGDTIVTAHNVSNDVLGAINNSKNYNSSASAFKKSHISSVAENKNIQINENLSETKNVNSLSKNGHTLFVNDTFKINNVSNENLTNSGDPGNFSNNDLEVSKLDHPSGNFNKHMEVNNPKNPAGIRKSKNLTKYFSFDEPKYPAKFDGIGNYINNSSDTSNDKIFNVKNFDKHREQDRSVNPSFSKTSDEHISKNNSYGSNNKNNFYNSGNSEDRENNYERAIFISKDLSQQKNYGRKHISKSSDNANFLRHPEKVFESLKDSADSGFYESKFLEPNGKERPIINARSLEKNKVNPAVLEVSKKHKISSGNVPYSDFQDQFLNDPPKTAPFAVKRRSLGKRYSKPSKRELKKWGKKNVNARKYRLRDSAYLSNLHNPDYPDNTHFDVSNNQSVLKDFDDTANNRDFNDLNMNVHSDDTIHAPRDWVGSSDSTSFKHLVKVRESTGSNVPVDKVSDIFDRSHAIWKKRAPDLARGNLYRNKPINFEDSNAVNNHQDSKYKGYKYNDLQQDGFTNHNPNLKYIPLDSYNDEDNSFKSDSTLVYDEEASNIHNEGMSNDKSFGNLIGSEEKEFNENKFDLEQQSGKNLAEGSNGCANIITYRPGGSEGKIPCITLKVNKTAASLNGNLPILLNFFRKIKKNANEGRLNIL